MFDRHKGYFGERRFWKGRKWREASVEEACATLTSIEGEWGYVCPKCRIPLEATKECRVIGDDDRQRTYVCRTCLVSYSYMWDCEEERRPMHAVDSHKPATPTAGTQKDETSHESIIDTKQDIVYHIPENLRYLLS